MRGLHVNILLFLCHIILYIHLLAILVWTLRKSSCNEDETPHNGYSVMFAENSVSPLRRRGELDDYATIKSQVSLFL